MEIPKSFEMEIPKRYELVLMLIGILPLIFFIQATIYQPSLINNLNSNAAYLMLVSLIIGLGLVLFLIGLIEYTESYFRDKERLVRENIIEIYKLDKRLKKVPKKYKGKLKKFNFYSI